MVLGRATLMGAMLAVFCASGSAQLAELTASDGLSGDDFGSSVAMRGKTLVGGSPYAGAVGAAYVFSGSGATWIQAAKLTASDGVSGGQFGYAVALGGKTVAVGAPMNAGGAVYIFVEPVTGWQNMTETAKLTYQGDGFGYSVAFAGGDKFLLAGAAVLNAAYVFDRPVGGWANATAPTSNLIAPSGATAFGTALATSGTTAVVGAHTTDNSSGAAYVFQLRTGVTNINASAALTASDSGGFLGQSVAISGGTIVAGAQGHDNGIGAAYVFVQPATGWQNMTQTAELGSGNNAQTAFGAAVAINAGTIFVGLPSGRVGAVDEFIEPVTGWANSTTPNFRFRTSVSSNFGGVLGFNGTILAVGDGFFNQNQGAVDLFHTRDNALK